MNSGQTRMRLVQAGAVLMAAALVAGCGSAYRAVITPITSTGPAAQPSSYAVVVSSPSPASLGIATIIDYAGDSVMATQPIGVGPVAFTVTANGFNAYTINSDQTMTVFPVSSSLQEKQVNYSTLPAGAQPIGLFYPSSGLWAADLTGNLVDVFGGSSGSAQAFVLAVPVAATPVMVIGPGGGGQRNFAISQVVDSDGVDCNNAPASVATNGFVTPIEVNPPTADPAIPVGKCPVYALQTNDYRRLFVINRGGDTINLGGSITVINTQDITADSCTPFQNQDGHWVTCHPLIALPAGPVYAEYNAATQQLVVANYDSNSISIIDVSMDEFGNDYNTYENANCTVGGVSSYANCGAITGGFGTTYTVPVGKNPASVTVLYDGSRAYTANQTDGTVSIVNLSSHTVEKAALPVVGHPRTVASTQNSEYGKVYVASPDTNYLTIISTTTDLVDTTILVQGNIVDVRVSTQNGSSGNANTTTREPGFGQPCNLPGAAASLAACQSQTAP